VISVLRYLYLKHKDWIYTKWPDITKLRNIALATQLGFYVLQCLSYGIALTYFATPYGWPQEHFLCILPPHLQVYLSILGVTIFTVPILISGIFYGKIARINQVMPINDEIQTAEAGGSHFSLSVLHDRTSNQHNTGQVESGKANSNSWNEIQIIPENVPRSGEAFQTFDNNLESRHNEEERLAAMRALKTNLILTSLLFCSFLLVLIPSNSLRIFSIFFSNSVQKGILPLLTPLVNFGIIRSVSLTLLKIFWKKE